MTLWIAALVLFLLTVLYELRWSKARVEADLLRIPLRRWVRLYLKIIVVLGWSMAVLLIGVSLTPIKAAFDLGDLSPFDLLGMSFALGSAVSFSQFFIRRSDIVATSYGLHIFHVIIPWSAIEELRTDGVWLVIRTPNLRRLWNSWTGRLTFSLWIWENGAGAGTRVVELYRRLSDSDAG